MKINQIIGEERNSDEMRRLKQELKSTKDENRAEYLRLEIRKLQGEIDLRKERGMSTEGKKEKPLFGRAAIEKAWDDESKRTTGQTIAQRQQWYKDNKAAVDKRMADAEKKAKIGEEASDTNPAVLGQLHGNMVLDGNITKEEAKKRCKYEKGTIEYKRYVKGYRAGIKGISWLDDPVNEDTLDTPNISTGDEVKVGKFKNRKAEVTGFTKDKHGQPVLKTTKGDQQLFKPRVGKLEPSTVKEDAATVSKSNQSTLHGYTIRIATSPSKEGTYKAIAFLPGKDGKVIRQEKFDAPSKEHAKKEAIDWILSVSETRTWNDIVGATATVDFNREFTLDFLDGNEHFWNKFAVLDDGSPAFLIAPAEAEEEFGAELLRGYGYSLASPKRTTTGDAGNTSAASIKKDRAIRAGLIPNGRYTLELTNKKSKTFGADLFMLAYHSTVDSPDSPVRLGVPGVTIAASRKG